MLPKLTDVAVVGAGPTGLVLANQLAMRGVNFVVLDRLPQHENTSRAAVVHARTLEVLDAIGVSARLVDRGIKVPVFTVRDRDRPLLRIDFSQLPTRYPYTLMIPQGEIEEVLESRLHELGAQVHRRMEVKGLVRDSEGTLLRITDADARAVEIRAKYVVGADGLHSVVREKTGIQFDGGTYAQSFILADVRMDWALDAHEVMLFFSPQGLVVVAPLPHGRHRIVATVDQAPEHPSLADVQAILDARGPVTGRSRISEIVWSSRFHVHHRVARRYRDGRLLLAGDAAHVHSPAGGQGMNTGIQDACVLGHLLAETLKQNGEPEMLDRYADLRRPVAKDVVALTDRLTRLATMHGNLKRSLRNTAIRALGSVPAFRNNLAMQLSELSTRKAGEVRE